MAKPSKAMAKNMTIQQVLDVMNTGEFDDLIGTMESEVLEFKGDLYHLDSMKMKLELAKDVSALANFSGGLILIGVGTTITEEHPYETIDKIRIFEQSNINIGQYEDVIKSWIYPNLNATIKWIPSSKEPARGIAYILIPESEISKKPFLVVKLLEENDKVLGNVVGFFQRKGDKIVHRSAEELHHALKDGLRFDDHLSEIEETVGKILSQSKTSLPSSITPEIIDQRINRAIDAVGLKDDISYVLVSYPDMDVRIQGLFESRTLEIVKLIDGPPELRYGGFDLGTHEQSRIIDGECRRSVLKPYRLLDVWRDGTIVSIGDGGEGFLCWGNHKNKGFLRINTIALIESTYLLCLFVKKIFEVGQVPECNLRLELHIKNISTDTKYGLPRAKPGSLSWQFHLDQEIVWTSVQNLSVNYTWAWRNINPENAAYDLVSELYSKFGLEHEFIPYVKEQNGEKVVDVEQIRNIR